MVKIFSLLLLIFIMPLAHSSERQLQIHASNTKVELGKPLQITITAHNISENLVSIRLDALMKDFGVYVIESSNKSAPNNIKIQELKISLYPHHIGLLQIPSLTLGKQKSLPLTVTIQPAFENHKALHFDVSVSSSSVWQRQQVIITNQILTYSKFARIELEDFTNKQIESYSLEYSRKELDGGQFLLTASWILYPLVSGKYNINLPAVNYRLKGKVQRRFIPPTIELNVKALPPYIPPLLPVGEITINKSIIENTEHPDASHILSINISSNHALPGTLPALPQDYLIDKKIIAGEIFTTLTIAMKKNIFNNNVNYQIPLTLNNSGDYYFPEITYRYFDPNSGKLITINSKPQNIFIISTWLKITLVVSLIIVTLIILIIAFNHIKHILQLNKIRRRIIKSTLMAKSPHELHQILNAYAKTYNWGSNMTIEDFQITWADKLYANESNTLSKLSIACYSSTWNNNSQSDLNKEIHQLLLSS